MSFFQRFKRYLIGVAIGVVLSGVFFKERLSVFTSWLPENVIKNTLKDANLLISKKANCQLDAYQLEEKIVDEVLDNGDVDFSQSQVDVKPYEYIIITNDNKYNFRFKVERDKNELLEIIGLKETTECD
ncbi:MAG: hypothetical protein ACI8XB_002080 [Patiriisocius sp.]|jgi:hypothetical protein